MPEETEFTRKGLRAANRSLGKQPPPRPVFIEKKIKVFFLQTVDGSKTATADSDVDVEGMVSEVVVVVSRTKPVLVVKGDGIT
ncbi:hypothetical protein TNCV_2664421 [Trichonephila clavipes]|nr:hypothetical protein TNCV_2664421 [Trichonephila clavipes]